MLVAPQSPTSIFRALCGSPPIIGYPVCQRIDPAMRATFFPSFLVANILKDSASSQNKSLLFCLKDSMLLFRKCVSPTRSTGRGAVLWVLVFMGTILFVPFAVVASSVFAHCKLFFFQLAITIPVL